MLSFGRGLGMPSGALCWFAAWVPGPSWGQLGRKRGQEPSTVPVLGLPGVPGAGWAVKFPSSWGRPTVPRGQVLSKILERMVKF